MNDRIAEIKARCAAATKGPWYVVDVGMELLITTDDTEEIRIAKVFPINGEDSLTNAIFLKNVREDIPFLLGEIDRLNAEVEEYHKWQEGKLGVEEYLTLNVKYQKLYAENNRLTAELSSAVADLNIAKDCETCRFDIIDKDACQCDEFGSSCNYEWRGVQK